MPARKPHQSSSTGGPRRAGSPRGGRVWLIAPVVGALALCVAGVRQQLQHSRHVEVRNGEVVVRLGPVRKQFRKLVADYYHLSEKDAEQWIARRERAMGAQVLDELHLPDNAVLDHVTVNADDASKPALERNGSTYLGSTMAFSGTQLRMLLDSVRGTPQEAQLKRTFAEAVRKGVVQFKLTDHQRQRLNDIARGRVSGEGRPRQAQATPLRVLVVACNFPSWTDVAPRYSLTRTDFYYQNRDDMFYQPNMGRTAYDHPISAATIANVGETPGGLVTVNFSGTRSTVTLTPPTWATQVHQRVAAQSFPSPTNLTENWFSLLFDVTNPDSVTNYFFENSHGQVRITGDRSDIVGWLESRHPLDRTDFGNQFGPIDAIQPGTPMIRDITDVPPNTIRYGSLNNTDDETTEMTDSWITLIWSTPPTNFGSYTVYSPATSNQPKILGTTAVQAVITDPFDRRRVFLIIDVGANTSNPNAQAPTPWSSTWRVDYTDFVTGQVVSFSGFTNFFIGRDAAGQVDLSPPRSPSGFSTTTFEAADVLNSFGPSDGSVNLFGEAAQPHRLKSYCYYTHNHQFVRGTDPYQLTTMYNRLDRSDPIGGSQDGTRNAANIAHWDRPSPYDHDLEDHANRANGGLSFDPSHSSIGLVTDVNALLLDNGIDASTNGPYDRVIYLFPHTGAVAPDLIPSGTSASGPFTGLSQLIATGFQNGREVICPENADLVTTAHELAHTFGMFDTYDYDFTYNVVNDPDRRVTHGAGPHSLMASSGGSVLDPLSKAIAQTDPNDARSPFWITPIPVTQDILNAQIPQIEGDLESPVVFSIPVNYPQAQQAGEFFLVQNHNRNDYGDSTPRGLVIYRVDNRYSPRPQDSPFSTKPWFQNNGGQNDMLWWLIPEQADGLFDLERTLISQPAPSVNTDSFGADAPSGVTEWTQFEQDLNRNRTPSSRSRGLADSSGNLVSGTAFDTYIRVTNIGNVGPVMSANIFVEPREVIVTGTPLAPGTVIQGQANVAMLQLDFDNRSTTDSPPGVSTDNVTIDTIRVTESGSAKNDADVTRVSLFDESNGVAGFQSTQVGNTPGDNLLGTAALSNQEAVFQNLNYLVKLGSANARTMYVVYDVAETAQTSPQVTVGARIVDINDLRPLPPGAVQERSGSVNRFPIPQGVTAESIIIEAPDTLKVTPINRAPATIPQGAVDQPMQTLALSVNRNDVTITQIRVDEGGTDTRDTDVVRLTLYEDVNQDGAVDANDVQLKRAVLSNQTALFTDLSFTVAAGTDRHLLITYDVSDFAEINRSLAVSLVDVTYITLGDPVDVVSPTNFPINSDNAIIVPAQHTLNVTARDVAPGQVDPDLDPSPKPGQGIAIHKITMTPDAGRVTVNSVRVDLAGTVVDGDVFAIRIFEDINENDTLDTADVEWGTGQTPAGTPLTATIALDQRNGTADTFFVDAGTSRSLLIVVDIGVNATIGNTVGVTLVDGTYIDVGANDVVQLSATPTQSPLALIRGFLAVTMTDLMPLTVDQGQGVSANTDALTMAALTLVAEPNPNDASDFADVVTIDSIRIDKAGSNTTDADTPTIFLYDDRNGDQTIDGGDVLLGSQTVSNSTVSFQSLALRVPEFGDAPGSPRRLLVAMSISATAQVNTTVGAQLVNTGYVSGNGVVVRGSPTPFPLQTTTATIVDGPPKLTTCSATETTVTVGFTEAITGGDTVTNYSVESPLGTTVDLTSATAAYDTATNTTTITLPAPTLVPGNALTVTVANVTDSAIPPNTIGPPNDQCATIVSDTTPPQVVSCSATGSQLVVTFNEPMDPTTTTNAANYAIEAPAGTPVTISGATVAYDNTVFRATLTNVTIPENVDFLVTVTNVRDLAGNAITTTNTCTGTVVDASTPKLTSCAAGIDFASGQFNEELSPTEAGNIANYTLESPPGTVIGLSGATVTYDPTSGFVISGLAPNALTHNVGFAITVRNVVDLAGNQIVADNVDNRCAGTVTDSVPPTVSSCSADNTSLTIVFSEQVEAAGAVTTTNYTVTVDQNPFDVSAATFSYDQPTRTLTVTGITLPTGGAVALKVINVVDLAGLAMVDDDIGNVCSTTVVDSIAPFVTACRADNTSFTVTFSEDMEPTAVAKLSNYSAEMPVGTPLSLSGATIAYDGTAFETTVSGLTMTPGSTLKVTVNQVTDLAGRLINGLSNSATCPVGFRYTVVGGLNTLAMVGVPAQLPSGADDPTVIFGPNAKVAAWDAGANGGAGAYLLFPQSPVSLRVGEGFWLKTQGNTTVIINNGTFTSTTESFRKALPDNNWFIFANPFLSPITWDVDNIQFSTGGADQPLRSLLSLSPTPLEHYGWRYSAVTGDYVLIADPEFVPGAAGQLGVGEAMWVKSNSTGVSLVIPPPQVNPSPVRRPVSGQEGWTAELIATAGSAVDAGNRFGVSPLARSGRSVRIQSPPLRPEQGDFVDLSFVATAGRSRIRSEVDLREIGITSAEWDIAVNTNVDDDVIITWPDLSLTPRDYRLLLTDLDTGQQRAMRTTSFMNLGRGPGERHLRVSLLPAVQGALRVSAMSVRQTPAGVAVTYTLNRAASVHVRVLTAAGRTIAVLPAAPAVQGLNTAVWSGRDASGRRAPRGLYLVEVRASDESGASVRTVRAAALR